MGDVLVRLPGVLEPAAGNQHTIAVDCPAGATVGQLLDVLARDYPVLGRRIRDETGAIRRFVNLYLDGEDVRRLAGTDTAVGPGQQVDIIQSVAGG
ncbi:MoaD/ThiS family protein [Paenarthrobacter sp. DKR-5]|uniref:MoaD/ThiS family protein n=1 Tax=Paenarthrobacter sp. DKR-5 TaxID=2835535 RepID=UPI001BDD958C|nr:MoaD/ThiS family protein [Paenarthrobacter sp. DKR-5]MBT1001457.1 MoaD/ThiS family protein [Paenarthrobacter sp. DKR-5]